MERQSPLAVIRAKSHRLRSSSAAPAPQAPSTLSADQLTKDSPLARYEKIFKYSEFLSLGPLNVNLFDVYWFLGRRRAEITLVLFATLLPVQS